MELGISSLGYIIEFGITRNYNNLIELLVDATKACLDFSEKNDLKVCELVIDPPEIIQEDFKYEFIELVNSYSVNKQIHGPFVDVNLCSHNKSISEASVESYIKTAKLCKEFQAEILTIHPGIANYMIKSIREFNKIQLKNAIDKLLNLTSSLDLTICLENMPNSSHIMLDEKDIESIFKIIDHKDLFLTYDTSHFYTTNGNVNLLWEAFHEKIKNVHLVENFTKKSDTHPPLGTGKIEFNRIFEIIRGYNYKGSLIIELSSAKDMQKSLDYIYKFV